MFKEHDYDIKIFKNSQVQWLTPVILAFWKAKASGSWDQAFQTSLANMVKPHLYQKYKN